MRPENVAFVGMPGTGKSYAARLRCEAHPRVLYVDPLDTAYPGHSGRPGEKWSHIFSAGNIDGAEYLLRHGPPTFRATVQIGDLTRQERNEALDRLCAAVDGSATASGAWSTICVDELGVILPRAGSGSAAAGEPLERLLRVGRHPKRRVCVYLISQRAVDLPPTMRALCERFEVRRQSERVDLDRLDQIERGLGERARKLEGFEYLVLEHGKVSGPFREV
jgi:hypothetical protein